MGDASGRHFTDYVAPTIRNEEIARRNGIDPQDGYAFRRYLMNTPPPAPVAQEKRTWNIFKWFK